MSAKPECTGIDKQFWFDCYRDYNLIGVIFAGALFMSAVIMVIRFTTLPSMLTTKTASQGAESRKTTMGSTISQNVSGPLNIIHYPTGS